MPTHLLDVDDDALLRILRNVVVADPPGLVDILLICKRFRNMLLAAATSVSLTGDNARLLQHCRSLRSMTLECSHLPWAADVRDGIYSCSPSQLSQLSSLTCIDANAASLSDGAEISKLRCLPELRAFHASYGMPDWGLEQLLHVTALRSLNLWGCTSLTAVSLPNLARFTFLDSLCVPYGPVHVSDCLAHMTNLTALTCLALACGWEDAGITTSGLSCLACLTSLRSLDLSSALADKGSGLHHLSALRCLEDLDLCRKRYFAHEDLAFLSCLTGLTKLDLYNDESDMIDLNKVTAHLTALTHLHTLCFNFSEWDDEGLANLARLTSLHLTQLFLDRAAANVPDAGFACLSSMSALRKLDIFFNDEGDGGGSDEDDDEDDDRTPRSYRIAEVVPHLISLHNLREVVVEDSLGDGALAQLCELRGLKRLVLERWLGVSTVTMQGLSHLTKLTELEALDLRQMHWRPGPWDWNVLFKHVSALTTLTELPLVGMNFAELTDDGLAHLSTLHRLRSLELQDGLLLTERALASLVVVPNVPESVPLPGHRRPDNCITEQTLPPAHPSRQLLRSQ